MAAVARLTIPADREARKDLPALSPAEEVSAPDVALRLLEDLDDDCSLYVAERSGELAGFALVTGLMVGDGGHLVELRRLYVTPERRLTGAGRQLLELVLADLAQRPVPPSLRAWAPGGSGVARFLEATGGSDARQRWKVGPGGVAVRGIVFSWTCRPAPSIQGHALA